MPKHPSAAIWLNCLPLLVRSCREVVSQLRIRSLWMTLAGFLAIPTYCISAETLHDALSEAYAGNPTLKAQTAHLNQVGEKVRQAESHWGPLLGVTADTGPHHWRQISGSNDGFVETNSPQSATLPQHDVDITLTQPLYRGGRTLAETRASKASLEAERARSDAAEQSILTSLAISYDGVLADRALLELTIQNESNLRAELAAAQERLVRGELTRTDAAQAQTHLAGGIADRQEAEANLLAASAEYEELVGHPPGDLTPFSHEPSADSNAPATLADAERTALEENPDLRASVFDQLAAQQDIALVKGIRLPSVDLILEATRNENATIRTPLLNNPARLDSLSALLRVTVPIFDSGSSSSQVRAAQDAYSQAQFTVEATKRSVLSKLRAAWATLYAARRRIQALQVQCDAGQLALQGSRIEQRAGTRTLLDVLNAEQDLLTARMSLIKSTHDATLAAIQLQSSIGRFTARILGINATQGARSSTQLP